VAPAPAAPTSGSLAGELAAFRAQRRPPAATSRGTRGKKVYGLTDTGRARLHELLADPDVSDDRTFALRVAFCRLLQPSERVALFERRRAELVRRHDQRRSSGPPSDGRVNTYLRSLLERDAATIAADLDWLDRLIADERAGVADGDGAQITGGQP
jgi:hypothetical protein